jgi:hypothetical protein
MKKIVTALKSTIRFLRDMFDDWLTKSAGIVCLLIIVLVFFNLKSNLAETYPLLGAVVFGMVPILFIAGGVIFVLAILKFSGQRNSNES